MLAIAAVSMRHGYRRGRALALGIAAGSFVWGTLTVSGLAALLATWSALLSVLKILGVAYLLWLAVGAFRRARTVLPDDGTPVLEPRGDRAGFRVGLALQLSNPKSVFTWLAVAALAIDRTASMPLSVALVLGTTTISAIGHVLYARLFSTTSVIEVYRRGRSLLERAFGCLYLLVAWHVLRADVR